MQYLSTLKLFQKGYGQYKVQIVVLAGLGFIGGFFEGIGINALIPLFSRLTGGGGADDLVSRLIGEVFARFEVGMGLKMLLLLVMFVFAFKAVVLLVSKYITLKISADYERKMRSALFQATLMADWPFLLQQKVGYLETVLMRDVYMSAFLLRYVSTIITSGAALLVYAGFAFSVSPIVTMISLGLGGSLLLVLQPLFCRVRKLSAKVVGVNKEVAHHVNENILGMKTIKSSNAHEHVSRKADSYFEFLKNAQLRINIFRDIPNVLIEPLSVIFVVAIFSFSYLTTDFTLAAFAVTMYLIHRIFTRLQTVQAELYKVNEAVPYLASVIDFQDRTVAEREVEIGDKMFNFCDSLAFREVGFSYSGDADVLSDVSFEVKRGEIVGLVGKSGSGKTTIADLILRFFRPSRGIIAVDDSGISEFDITEWRKNIGYVSQDMFLMNDTIANNIRFYDETISDEDMAIAATSAHILDFINAQPDTWQTLIGERGILLSGGERQRLVLARALARHPQILILDEATSALDNESEVMIQKAIEGLKGKTTIFVIAHRLSTLLNCDKIFVLEDGRIKEEGSPKALLENKDSYFYKVYNIRDNAMI